jgi:hypothetical protein
MKKVDIALEDANGHCNHFSLISGADGIVRFESIRVDKAFGDVQSAMINGVLISGDLWRFIDANFGPSNLHHQLTSQSVDLRKLFGRDLSAFDDDTFMTKWNEALSSARMEIARSTDEDGSGDSQICDAQRIALIEYGDARESKDPERIAKTFVNALHTLPTASQQAPTERENHIPDVGKMVAALQSIADGSVTQGKSESHVATVLAYQSLARQALQAEMNRPKLDVPFEDLAPELWAVAQTSPTDGGFSQTIARIESWLRDHFSDGEALAAKLEPVAYKDEMIYSDATPQRVMERGYALCPSDLPHRSRMAWLADYYERNRQTPSAQPVQGPLTDAQKLATAIADAATRAGITNSQMHSFSGPQLLMLLDDLVEMALATPPAQPAPVPEESIRKVLRSALAWGKVMGEAIPPHQWDEMRETQVKQGFDDICAAIANTQPAAQPAPNASQPEDVVKSNQKYLNELRLAGYAVVIFSPDELGTANAKSLEERLVELGNESISDLEAFATPKMQARQ